MGVNSQQYRCKTMKGDTICDINMINTYMMSNISLFSIIDITQLGVIWTEGLS